MRPNRCAECFGFCLTRLALGLEYDGTDWNGWQTQPNGQTVQDQLETAIAEFTGSAHPTTCAGRTDAGVHARGQVVHIDTTIDRADWNWVRGLNALLPSSISVGWARHVSDGFHARYSAVSREYCYRMYCSPVRSPLQDRFSVWSFRSLDVARMREAAHVVMGEHDFSAFRSAECQAASPVRTIDLFDIIPNHTQIEFRIRGNAFLHHMVRNLIGSIVEVGRGAQPVEWMAQVVASRDRRLAARTFPAHGLCLTHVEYDSQLLPEQACEPELKSAE